MGVVAGRANASARAPCGGHNPGPYCYERPAQERKHFAHRCGVEIEQCRLDPGVLAADTGLGQQARQAQDQLPRTFQGSHARAEPHDLDFDGGLVAAAAGGGGPIENTSVPTSQPQLALATIGSDGLPVLPPVVLEKFDQNETYSAQWAKIVSDFRATMTNEVVPKLNVRTAAVPEVASSAATAPDFSIPPFPVPPPRVIFPTTPAADFKVDEVLLGSKRSSLNLGLTDERNQSRNSYSLNSESQVVHRQRHQDFAGFAHRQEL